jgi:hypothetical protein
MKTTFLKRSIVGIISSLIAFPFGTLSGIGSAISGGYQSGRIMDDSLFYAANTLSVDAIQLFLNSKVPTCDTNHARTSSANDSGAPYICLKSFVQNIGAKAADQYCPGSISAADNMSTAQILYEVSRACEVSVKVLLVLLQKEQSLITDTWPWTVQYTKATGYGCPDSSLPTNVDANQNGCYDEYEGFYNQIYYGARQYQRYVKQSSSFNYRVGQTSYVSYQANRPDCGGTNITMQTKATAALYNYTPYQPNVAALNNLYGTGDQCSAYGNRNFWRLYNDWFGPTTSDSEAHTINFIRMNHASGRTEQIGVSSISSFGAISRNNLVAYPSIPVDGSVVPVFWPNGDLVFIRLNHYSGRVELLSLDASSGYQHIVNYKLIGYPTVETDGSVIPLFNPKGDLSMIRLNHSSGRVEVLTLSASSGFQDIIDYHLTIYPAIPADGSVIPTFWPNGDLVFVRLNHFSGRVEIVSLGASTGFQQVVNYKLIGYPAVETDGSVVPMFTPKGDLSMIRKNHSSGRAEVLTLSASSGFQDISDYELTAYPAISDLANVQVLLSR